MGDELGLDEAVAAAISEGVVDGSAGELTLDAATLRLVLTGAAGRPPEDGLVLRDLVIDESVSLANAALIVPVLFERCQLRGGLDLSWAEVIALRFDGVTFGPSETETEESPDRESGDGEGPAPADVAGPALGASGLTARSFVYFERCHFGGSVWIQGADLEEMRFIECSWADPAPLVLDRSSFRGDLLLAACAQMPAVSAVGAQLHGALRMVDVGEAGGFNGDSMTAGRDVEFRDLRRCGSIELLDGTIRGVLQVSGLELDEAAELSLLRTIVDGAVLIRRCQSLPTVMAASARLGALELSEIGGLVAFDLSAATVARSVQIVGVTSTQGARAVDLTRVRVGGDLVAIDAELASGLQLGGATVSDLHMRGCRLGTVPVEDGADGLGSLLAPQITANGNVFVDHCELDSAFLLQGASIAGSTHITESRFGATPIELLGSQVRTSINAVSCETSIELVLSKVTLEGAALLAGVRVNGAVVMTELTFVDEGEVPELATVESLVRSATTEPRPGQPLAGGEAAHASVSLAGSIIGSGVALVGVLGIASLDLSAMDLSGNATIRTCRFRATDAAVSMSLLGARIGGALIVHDVLAPGLLTAANLEVGSNAMVAGCAFGGAVLMAGARITGDLGIHSLRAGRMAIRVGDEDVPLSLHLVGTSVGLDLRLSDVTATTASVQQVSVGSTLSVNGGTFGAVEHGGGLLLDGASVTGFLQISEARVFGVLNLERARVGGDVTLDGQTRVTGLVLADGFETTRSFVLSDCVIDAESTPSSAESDVASADAGLAPVEQDEAPAEGSSEAAMNRLSMSAARIGENLRIRHLTVVGGVWLSGLDVTQRLTIEACTIGAAGSWSLVLDDAELTGSVSVQDSTFAGGISFDGATSGASVSLDGITIHGDPDRPALVARQARLRGPLRLGAITAVGGVDLTRADLERIDDRPSSWSDFNSVTLTGLRLQHVASKQWDIAERVAWLERATESGPAPFELYAERLQAVSRPAEANRLRVAAERVRSRRFRRAALGWIGYGYRPALALVPLLAAVTLTLGVVTWGREQQRFVATDAPEGPEVVSDECDERTYPCLSPLGYSLDVLVPIVDFDEQSAWRPATFSLRLFLWLMTASGWLLTTLVVLGLTNRIRK